MRKVKTTIQYLFVFLLVGFLAACGGKKDVKEKAPQKETKVVKDTTRKSTHEMDYENFKKGEMPIKKTPEQIIHF